MQRGYLLALTLSVVLLGSSVEGASPVVDDVNGSRNPPCLVYSPNIVNLGWYYTPSFNYNLDGITSTFRAITSPPVTTRNVTLGVYDEVGGTLLRSGTFSAGAAGGNLGMMFDPLPVVAGEDYFIGYQNVAGLGLNVVDFEVSLPPPTNQPNPAVEFQSGWYSGANFGTFVPHTMAAPAGFAAPILRFHGVIPEPSTALLMTMMLFGMGISAARSPRVNARDDR
jgi:hypothetical protein